MPRSSSTSEYALLLNHEIANVVTAMRHNAKWAVVAKYYEEDRSEPSRYDDHFRALRAEIFQHEDWSSIDPRSYLEPFLVLIKAREVSGPITGAAVQALRSVLSRNLLGIHTLGVEKAINQLVEDTTQCKFESTNNTSDEIVLFNVLQVLALAVKCPAGTFLTDSTVCKAFQAAYMLGEPRVKPKECGELMTHYSRQVCGEMITAVFTRLADQARLAELEEGVASAQTADHINEALVQARLCKHGVDCASELLHFLMDLIHGEADEGRVNDEETVVFSLQMLHQALMAAGSSLQQFKQLITQIHCDLFHAMCHAAVNYPGVAVISGICQVSLAVYQFLGKNSMTQLELILCRVLLKIADGKGVASLEQQEAALEGILDLCRQPGFAHDAFLNCDCRIDRSNLFEDVCSLISKTAFPINKASLGPLHYVSLEALLAILNALASTTALPIPPPLPEWKLPSSVDIWGPISKGDHLSLQSLVPSDKVSTTIDITDQNCSAELTALKAGVLEKHLKVQVALAADHFNKDYKKGLQFLQNAKLLPRVKPAGELTAEQAASGEYADEDTVATGLGRFLRCCPGLSKLTIGELLGEPDPFYLKVLSTFTETFDFANMKFDAAIRLFLESFRLPGEAQKIDRIINSFGKHYFQHNPVIFKNADAAYVLSYSVIMLNTDRHNSQVKTKMTLEAFRRNLRGVNDGQDFPEEFLDGIFNSIMKEQLRMSESSSMDVSRQTWQQLSKLSDSPRGQMLSAAAGHELFSTSMFRLIWGPAVHAMCVLLDNCDSEAVAKDALHGLRLAAKIAAQHEIEDVADGIVVSLSKLPSSLNFPSSVRPEVVFGSNAKVCLATETIFYIVSRFGDSLRSGWTNVMELILKFHRFNILPESFVKALDSEEGGALTSSADGGLLRYKRDKSKTNISTGSSSFLRSFSTSITQLITLPTSEPEFPPAPSSEAEKRFEQNTKETMEACHFEDVFRDSKFLKPGSLQQLVQAIIWASGPLPRPSNTPSSAADWDIAELCLDLLFTVMLRNRDRIALLWPKVYEHFKTIFSRSKEVDQSLVMKGIVGMLRLCQRLLPYKTDISEPLMKGIQLVQLVDDQVAQELATTIANEILNLLKGAAQYIQNQQAWISLCSLLKIIQYDPASFSICVEIASWVVKDSLTMLNYTIVLQTLLDLLERAVPENKKGERAGHPSFIPQVLDLFRCSEEWLELWWDQVSVSTSPEQMERMGMISFKLESWLMLVGILCKLSANPNVDVRNAVVGYLQRAVVAAEKLNISAEYLYRSLDVQILPLMKDLSKDLNSRSLPQADVTMRELVRSVSKMVLLFLPQLGPLPLFGALWRTILDILVSVVVSSKSEVLSEAVPEALKNMLLVLREKGLLKEGWKDNDGTDLWELTWKSAKKISAGLTPQLLAS